MEAIVEIPKFSNYKYEADNFRNLQLDRVLNQNCPYNYGFVPSTLCGDGDPLDVFIISKYPIPPLTRVKVSLIGGLVCNDNGDSDDKLIGVLEGEEKYWANDITLPMWEITNYLTTYKTGFQILKEMSLTDAFKSLNDSLTAYECGKGKYV